MKSEAVALEEAETNADKRAIYKKYRNLTETFINKIKKNIGDIRYREAEVGEDGVRSVGTFNPAFVKALAGARRLPRAAFEEGAAAYRLANNIKPSEPLDYSKIEVLNGITIAGQKWMQSLPDLPDID